MKKKTLILMIGFLLIGFNLYAADGDLVVKGKIALDPGAGPFDTSPAIEIGDPSTDFTRSLRFVGNGGVGSPTGCNIHYESSNGWLESSCGLNVDWMLFGGNAQQQLFMTSTGFLTVFARTELRLDTGRDDLGETGGTVKVTDSNLLVTNGNVGIGMTTSPSYTLHVNGNIGTTNSGEVHSDYVFEPDYPLMKLEELEGFIKKEKHLPGIITDPKKVPNIDILSLNGKLLAKIEELTLYIIEQNRKISALEQSVNKLESSNE